MRDLGEVFKLEGQEVTLVVDKEDELESCKGCYFNSPTRKNDNCKRTSSIKRQTGACSEGREVEVIFRQCRPVWEVGHVYEIEDDFGNEVKLEVVTSETCTGCYFEEGFCAEYFISYERGDCQADNRLDGKSVKFLEVR